MLSKVKANEFNEIIQSSIGCDVNFLAITAINTGLKPVFYIFRSNNEATIGFALFEKKNKIVLPPQFLFYSGLWIKGGLRNDEFNTHLFNAITQLKKLYVSIKLVTTPQLSDLRPFLWNNFKPNLRYTYCKETKDNNYSEGILRDYKRAVKKFKLHQSVCLFSELDWKEYIELFRMVGYNFKRINLLKIWLTELDKNEFLYSLKIINSEMQNVGSGIILLDKVLKIGYFIYMDISKNQHRSETNSYIYIEVQKWLFENGYDEMDYFGANLNSIANYKSRYLPRLKPYYVLYYHKYNLNFIGYLKTSFKKIFNL